ncbi:hypothetical protein [Polycladidibacter hongkongensis]|uniref:hypothetical protein n=1 Tax=Polycladidibacter hongkongensis TaxID=1647556 RepID=UPI000832F468|nr:hypothetical protein [Pseudovibrio hongkongensis]
MTNYLIKKESREIVGRDTPEFENWLTGKYGADGWERVPDPEPEPPTRAEIIAQIKAEAHRRIVSYCPEWKQRNLTARAAELALRLSQGATLTAEGRAEVAAGQVIWDHITAIRAASDALEAMEPLPDDVTAAELWPAVTG